MTVADRAPANKNISYELFILAISTLAIVNIIIILLTNDPDMDQVVMITNFTLSLILMVDFVYRLISAPDRAKYLISGLGWLDFLGSIPFFWMPIFRLFRILRILRLLRQIGTTGISRDLRHHPASSVLATVSFLVLLVIQFGSYFMIGAEALSANSNISQPLDALWWSLVTITTVGYGDKYPVTDLGRVIGALVILLGVIMFSVLTSFFTSKFHARAQANTEEILAATELEIHEIHQLLKRQAITLTQLETKLARIEKQLDKDAG